MLTSRRTNMPGQALAHPQVTGKVLLVDDEREICMLMSSALRKYGVPSAMAHSLGDARRQLANGIFSAIVLDIHLPDGLGYELIPEIKARHTGTTIIVISAVDTERGTALERGADAFIAKPFDRSAILQVLRGSGIAD